MNSRTVKEIYGRNYGSGYYYKRAYCDNLRYTEGLMDFQNTLNAYWFIDIIISYMPKIIQTYKQTNDYFYIITIKINDDSSGTIEVFREGYINDKYNEHITVIKQKIPYIDLPKYDYKFYLALASAEPILFTLLLTSEY